MVVSSIWFLNFTEGFIVIGFVPLIGFIIEQSSSYSEMVV